MRRVVRILTAIALIATGLMPREVAAKDHFLTIGGGSSASNNQVSLEKNVLFLQRYLQDSGLGSLPMKSSSATDRAARRICSSTTRNLNHRV